eukprot:scaffold788_cov231-Pinguiococcus_pyrenoidosus.AAC.17
MAHDSLCTRAFVSFLVADPLLLGLGGEEATVAVEPLAVRLLHPALGLGRGTGADAAVAIPLRVGIRRLPATHGLPLALHPQFVRLRQLPHGAQAAGASLRPQLPEAHAHRVLAVLRSVHVREGCPIGLLGELRDLEALLRSPRPLPASPVRTTDELTSASVELPNLIDTSIPFPHDGVWLRQGLCSAALRRLLPFLDLVLDQLAKLQAHVSSLIAAEGIRARGEDDLGGGHLERLHAQVRWRRLHEVAVGDDAHVPIHCRVAEAGQRVSLVLAQQLQIGRRNPAHGLQAPRDGHEARGHLCADERAGVRRQAHHATLYEAQKLPPVGVQAQDLLAAFQALLKHLFLQRLPGRRAARDAHHHDRGAGQDVVELHSAQIHVVLDHPHRARIVQGLGHQGLQLGELDGVLLGHKAEHLVRLRLDRAHILVASNYKLIHRVRLRSAGPLLFVLLGLQRRLRCSVVFGREVSKATQPRFVCGSIANLHRLHMRNVSAPAPQLRNIVEQRVAIGRHGR